MIIFILVYFVMGMIFLIWRFFYPIVSKKKFIGALIAVYIIAEIVPIESITIVEDFLSAIIYFIMVMVFAPPENSAQKNFPVEIFGFIYSIALVYCCAGDFALDFFPRINFFNKICGFTVTASY